jgi:DNA-binding SARP family transcriptional activator
MLPRWVVTDLVATGMEFCLLGPLEVRCGGAVIPVPAGKQRAVLAALLLSANRVVPIEDMADALWGTAPPPSARVTVQNYVVRLRKTLSDHGHSRIATRPPGYLIRVGAGELDVTQFENLLGAARQAAREASWDVAATEARAALALWRGEPLVDAASELLALREVPRLADLRLQALQTRIDSELHLGRHAEVIGELRYLVGAHPLQERLHGLLLLALYRDGRQAEALAAYQTARRVLIEELGTEPGPELQDLHQQILTGDRALDLSGRQRPPGSAGQATPRELPPTVPGFTGRSAELRVLTEMLDQAGTDAPGTVVISAIGGTAGVGKTARALYWAHQVAARFGDGQLHVNLRGFAPAMPDTGEVSGGVDFCLHFRLAKDFHARLAQRLPVCPRQIRRLVGLGRHRQCSGPLEVARDAVPVNRGLYLVEVGPTEAVKLFKLAWEPCPAVGLAMGEAGRAEPAIAAGRSRGDPVSLDQHDLAAGISFLGQECRP